LKYPDINQKELAEKIGVSPPAVNARIQRMKREGIIKGMVPVIDLKKLNYQFTILVNVRAKNGKLIEAAERILEEEHVSSVYRITGEYDIVVVAKFRTMDELNLWNQKMSKMTDMIERTNTSLVWSVYKEGTTPNEIL
jgi:DNA-binding Lrp family transcriptional regulator